MPACSPSLVTVLDFPTDSLLPLLSPYQALIYDPLGRPRSERITTHLRYVGSSYPPFYMRSLSAPSLRGTFAASVGCLRYGMLIAFATWDLCRLSWSLPLWDLDRLCNVGPWSPQLRGILIASDTWDFGRFSWTLPLCRIFVASVGRLRYWILIASATWHLVVSAMGPWSPLLWDLCCRFCYVHFFQTNLA